MNTKIRLFKHTFIILSIMCCFLLGNTSVIYAINGLNQNVAAAEPTEVSTESAPANSTQVQSPPESEPTQIPATESSKDIDIEKDNGIENTPSTETNITYPSITISAVGDLMAHQSNLNNAYNPKTKTYDFSGFLEYIKPYISKSELTIGNFETVTAGPKYGFTSYPLFNTPDAILSALRDAGFDVLSTANNHCLDRGINGLASTISKIEKNKMINVGSSIDGKNKYITKEINGIKVSILSYTYSFNGHDSKLNAAQKLKYLSPIDEARIKSDITAVKAKGADAVIVIMHWGTEYQRLPNTNQTNLAKKIFNWGADIILGSHPHVVQKSEIMKINGKDKFVIYSMGNFISGYRRSDKAKRPNKIFTEDGVVVQFKLEKDPEGGIIIKQVNYIPTWVDKYYINNRPVFKIIPIPNPNPTGSYITNYNKNFVKQSYKNTMGIMSILGKN